MSALRDENVRNEVFMCSKNPCHDSEDINWTINEVTQVHRLETSLNCIVDISCKPKFELVASFNAKYPFKTNVILGLRRIDDYLEPLHVELDLKLTSVNDDIYSTKTTSYTCPAMDQSSIYRCFSEIFTKELWSRMKVKTSFSYNTGDDVTKLSLHAKKLIGSYGTDDNIFVLPEDTLVVRGKIKVYGCCLNTHIVQTHTVKLLEDFREAFEKDLYTDFELHVGDQVVRVHRFVLSVRSPVFKNMLEHDMLENRTGVIKISDMKKPVLDALVWYMYTGAVKADSWDILFGLYCASHLYEMSYLQETVSRLLESKIEDENVCQILEHANLYNEKKLKCSAQEHIVRYFARIKPTTGWQNLLSACPDVVSEILEIVTGRYT